MANYKDTVKALAHVYSDLAFESRYIPSVEELPFIIANAKTLKVTPHQLATDIHLYRNSFQFQKDLSAERMKKYAR